MMHCITYLPVLTTRVVIHDGREFLLSISETTHCQAIRNGYCSSMMPKRGRREDHDNFTVLARRGFWRHRESLRFPHPEACLFRDEEIPSLGDSESIQVQHFIGIHPLRFSLCLRAGNIRTAQITSDNINYVIEICAFRN